MPITTTPSGGPQGAFSTYTPIYSQTLSSTASTVTFSNIPQTYTDLVLVCSTTNSGSSYFGGRFNEDSGANYSDAVIWGATNAESFRYSDTTSSRFGYCMTANSSIKTAVANFINYSNNTTFKTVITRGGDTGAVGATTSLYRSVAPITSIQVFFSDGASIAAGSTFTLYGIKAAATQFIPTKAFGGDIVASDGTYAYHAFLNTGRFTATQTLSCDILQVAGGGGANNDSSGGGGAGGLLAFTSQSVTAQAYTVTIGAGGGYATNGSNSQFGSVTASVGGGRAGGTSGGAAGASGGSGGGGYGGGGGNTGGAGTAGQGYAGGAGYSAASPYGGGGGGGAGAAGNAGRSTSDGAGGIGATSSLINAMGAATTTGRASSGNYYFAGGGGGNGGLSSAGVGGLGGGGNGGSSADSSASSTNGGANTGGGAGGGNSVYQRSGGSGIIIVRYAL